MQHRAPPNGVGAYVGNASTMLTGEFGRDHALDAEPGPREEWRVLRFGALLTSRYYQHHHIEDLSRMRGVIWREHCLDDEEVAR